VGEIVQIKVKASDAGVRRGGRKIGQACTEIATIKEVDECRSRYKVEVLGGKVRWVTVANITSITRESERKKQEEAKSIYNLDCHSCCSVYKLIGIKLISAVN
jgi:hypothetical protein